MKNFLISLTTLFVLVFLIFETAAWAEQSRSRSLAQRIFSHVAGVKLGLDHPTILEMDSDLRSNDLEAAARKAVNSPSFAQITLFNFFAVKSVRSDNPDIPMNDFIAMGIANTLENKTYTNLVAGNFSVEFRPEANADFRRPSLSTNDLEGVFSGSDKTRLNPENLKTIPGQFITDISGNIINNPEPAGALTSRQFLKEHAFLGTNRRLVQYAFKNFLCKDITDIRVGGGIGERFINRDVSRAPGGDQRVYMSECRTCHGVLDPFRRAFAFFDFAGNNQESGRPVHQGNQVVGKINLNNEYNFGAQVANNRWFNLANSGSNASYFGWDSSLSQGMGASQLGLLISRSRAFSSCAVEQVWSTVCKKSGAVIPTQDKTKLTDQFIEAKHNLKELFVQVSVHPLCLGDDE